MTTPAVVGTAAVDVVPIIPNFHNKLKALVLPIADKVGREAGERMGKAMSDAIVISIPSAINTGGKAGVRAAGKQGDNAGGAFARSIRRKLEVAFKAMPKLDVKLSDTGVDADLARIRAKLETLSNKRIGIDVSAEAAAAEVERLEEQLRRLGAAHPNIAVRADTAVARAALAEIRAQVAALTARPGVIQLETDGAFGARMRAVVEQAQASLPEINIAADTSPARTEIQRLRTQLDALADQRVGIDIDAKTALAQINAIQERLAILSVSSADIDVRVDAAAAAAQLAALQAQADDTKIFRIQALADTSGARSSLIQLGVQMAVLMAIPLGPVLAAGLGAVVSMATAAGAGVGALALAAVPAIKGVAEALKAKTAAEDDAGKASDRAAKATTQAAQRALSMAGAQASLASAHRNAARSIAQANRQVADAERAVAQAAQRAALQREQAAEAVERAEESLTDAKRSAHDAERSLTEAREEAADQLRDLNDRLAEGALDQREATLRVREAQEDLAKIMLDPKATDLQKERAQLAADQAEANAKRQKQDFEDLQKDAEKQRKAGVDGNEDVKRAAQGVADAQKNVRDQTEAVADAHRDAARASADAAQTVADAQRGLSDAVRNASDAQVSAAEAIAGAERGVASARLQGADATSKALTKQEEYRAALAKLSPSQRELYDSIAGPKGIKSAFDAWQKSLQPHVLPLFTRGVDSAKNSLPGLTPLAIAAAGGIETLMDKASAQMKTPFWMSFKAELKESVEPAVVGFGVAFGNVIKGVAGIIDAFLPHMDGIARKSDSITGRFAKWGTSLKGSPDFEKFLAYVKESSPGLAQFIGDVLRAALDLSKALAPLSAAMFATLAPLLDAISWLSEHAPGFIQTLWAIWAVQKALRLGMILFAGALVVYEIAVAGATLVTAGWAAAITATGIVPVIRAIVLIVALLVAGLIYAYNNFDWFKAAVDGAWRGIQAVISFVWNSVLKPAFEGIWAGLKKAGDAAVWLWNVVLKPTFSFIAQAAQFLLTAVVTWALLPIYLAFQLLGGIASWLWEKAIKPAFDGIAFGAKWLWEKAILPFLGMIGDKAKWVYEKMIKPAASGIRSSFRTVADVASWLWDTALRPVFNSIADKAGWLHQKAIKPAFDKIKSAMKSVADSFKTGKDLIKESWDQVKGIAKTPVKFIVDKVYNGAIVPLWSKVADITGADKLKKLDIEGWHTGGVMSGYSPGRDDRVVAVGGGEAIMRPEWTRAIGEDKINAWNAAARQGGISGVQKAISNGMPAYADGGVVGWLKDKGNAVGDFFSGVGDFLDPSKIFSKATDLVKDQMKPILTNPWAKEIGKIPVKLLGGLKDKAMEWLSFGGGGGQWMKPVNGPYGTPFGKKGSMWSSGRHTGLDFPAATGALIKAVAGGKVSQVTSGGPYGKHAMINHGGGLSSLYAHMSSISAKLGQTVNAGSRVGAVGATGNVTGPHLHLEARQNGRAVDPMSFLTGGGGGSGGKGVERWRGVVQQALKMTGNPAGYANLTLRRMNQESGGDPNVVNRWDSNWKAGHPSVGLMQLIRGTFRAYAGSMKNTGPFSYGVSTNPLANIYSSMRYAKSRYGSLPRAYDRPGGYAEGGFPQLGELAWVGENGPELVRFLAPAQVHSNPDSMALARQATSLSTGRSATPTVNVEARVFVGDREITDIVRVEVEARESETASAIDTGRWV